jgi:hypothetical protein
VLFTSEWARSGSSYGVRVYDANTMSLRETIDPYRFGLSGNHAMGSGRMEISPDGGLLAVSVDSGVRLYDVRAYVPEPSTTAMLLAGGCAVLLCRIRRTQRTRHVRVRPGGTP